MTDRAREALFSSLGDTVPGARVLDLFAGSGSIGLEALSRGAATVIFVERSRSAIDALQANIEAVGLGGEIVRADVAAFLERASGVFHLVFVDPPYAMSNDVVEEILARLVVSTAVGGTVILHRRTGDPTPQPPTNLDPVDERTYGGTHLIRYTREGP